MAYSAEITGVAFERRDYVGHARRFARVTFRFETVTTDAIVEPPVEIEIVVETRGKSDEEAITKARELLGQRITDLQAAAAKAAAP